MGVTRAALYFPDDIDGLIYISPVIEADLITTDAYVQNTADKPILVIYGGADRQVPAYYVEVCVDLLQRQGADVQHRRYEQEDHFLFMSAFDRLAADIEDWMEAH
jgi:predicted esterase